MTPSANDTAGGAGRRLRAPVSSHGVADPLLRVFALSVALTGITFVINAYLVIWRGWPGVGAVLADLGLFGIESRGAPLDGFALLLGWIEVLLFVGPVVAIVLYVVFSRTRTLHSDSDFLSDLSAYIARGAFWGVLFVGIVDAFISFLRVEDFLIQVFGQALAQDLGRASFRGDYIHFPLIGLGFVIAAFTRSAGFVWLALLVVVAEMQIVIFRFIFSYEQAFMADLVRFWYGAMFLFASSYTLLHEGHVRVDILYANLSDRAKAWSNAMGCVLLGTPVCWVILTMGMSGRSNVITSPLLNYEITQAGFGLYVKYLMAGFLAVYAITMLLQFMSYFLNSVGFLLHEPDAHAAPPEEALV